LNWDEYNNITDIYTMSELPPFERYQYKPFIGSSHLWALEQLKECAPTSQILDIGSGSGAIGQELKNSGFLNLSAVEIDEETRAHTKHIYSVIAPTLADFVGQRFNAILLLDIIEHLSNPVDFLKAVTSVCAPGALLFISVPNIAHWSIRLMLLCGYFEYMERGPLDKTHLHFFTQRHLKNCIESVPGFSIIDWNSSIVPLELMTPKWIHNHNLFKTASTLRQRVAKQLPGISAYQLLVKVKYRVPTPL
jgi:SAM-dependent methyltransferase